MRIDFQLMTGIRLAVGLAWVVLVPAEMLGVANDLGYFLLDTRDRLDYSELMATILVIGVLGYLLDLSVRKPEVGIAALISLIVMTSAGPAGPSRVFCPIQMAVASSSTP